MEEPIECAHNGTWHPHIEVRCVGFATYEARTEGGLYSSVGCSRNDAVVKLHNKLPEHGKPTAQFVPDPKPRHE